jgi:hypothetical protein
MRLIIAAMMLWVMLVGYMMSADCQENQVYTIWADSTGFICTLVGEYGWHSVTAGGVTALTYDTKFYYLTMRDACIPVERAKVMYPIIQKDGCTITLKEGNHVSTLSN